MDRISLPPVQYQADIDVSEAVWNSSVIHCSDMWQSLCWDTNVTSTCYKFVLTIPVVQALNGTTVMCEDAISAHTVGNGNSFDVQTREYRSVW